MAPFPRAPGSTWLPTGGVHTSTGETLRSLNSKQEGRSLVDLALAWTLGHPGITSVLTGGRRPEHIGQAFEALEKGLSSELRKQLDQASNPINFD